jgi:hypothetical protein
MKDNIKHCHEIDIFFEGLNIVIRTFCECADGFQALSKVFHYSIVFRIRIRIRMFLGLPDPHADPLDKTTDLVPDPDPSLFSEKC